jgi:hypothetical protein
MKDLIIDQKVSDTMTDPLLDPNTNSPFIHIVHPEDLPVDNIPSSMNMSQSEQEDFEFLVNQNNPEITE